MFIADPAFHKLINSYKHFLNHNFSFVAILLLADSDIGAATVVRCVHHLRLTLCRFPAVTHSFIPHEL